MKGGLWSCLDRVLIWEAYTEYVGFETGTLVVRLDSRV